MKHNLIYAAVFAFSLTALESFSPLVQEPQKCLGKTVIVSSTVDSSDTISLRSEIQSNLDVLVRAAETKKEDSESVYQSLSELEKQMRRYRKADASVAASMQEQLNGSWRLIFTTGTAKSQQRLSGGRINYFPLKAVQSFNTTASPMTIENGIYVGDFPILKFQGRMEFDQRKCRLEFDFDRLQVLQFVDINLGKGKAAELGAKSGLGSESNVANASKDKSAFFNWISADSDIATARGGGGGLALWKRID